MKVEKLTPYTDGRARRLEMTEMSAVAFVPKNDGRGANPEANMTFTKSDKTNQTQKSTEVKKGPGDIADMVSSVTDGHQHSIDISYRNGEICMITGYAQAVTNNENGNSHDHRLIRNENGSYSFVMDAGHTHEDITAAQIMGVVSATILEKNHEGKALEALTKLEKELKTQIENTEATMADDTQKTAEELRQEAEEATKKQAELLAKLQADVASLSAVAGLTGAQKTHYDALDATEKTAFLALDVAKRDEAISTAALKAAQDAAGDPIVFTSADGTAFRKSHDPVLVSMAKNMDELRKENLVLKSENEDKDLEKRAKDALAGLPGDLETHKGLLKAAEELDKKSGTTKSVDALKAQAADLAKMTVTIGTTEGGSEKPVNKEADDKLTALAKERATKDGVDFYTAYKKVTDENPELRKAARSQIGRI